MSSLQTSTSLAEVAPPERCKKYVIIRNDRLSICFSFFRISEKFPWGLFCFILLFFIPDLMLNSGRVEVN